MRCRVQCSGNHPTREGGRSFTSVVVEMQLLDESTGAAGNERAAPIYREITQHYCGPLVTEKPVFLVSIDTGRSQATPTAFVTTMEFH